MQKNVLLFVVLAVLTFLGWGWFTNKYYPPQSVKPSMKAPSATSAVSVVPSAAVTAGTATQIQGLASAKSPVGLKEERVTVKTEKLEVSFSSLGAKIVSWKLLPYRESKNTPGSVQLIPEKSDFNNYGALEISGADLENAPWLLETKAPRLNADGSQELSFSTHLPKSQVLVRKTFVVSKDDFLAHVKLTFSNQGKTDLKLGRAFFLWGPSIGQPDTSQQGTAAMSSVVQINKKIERERSKDKDEVFEYQAPKWAAIKNHYFVAAFIPEGDDFIQAQTRRYKNKTLVTALGPGELILKAGATRVLSTNLYAGPQIYERLQKFGVNLQRVVEFQFYGFFEWLTPLCIGMLRVMRWFFVLTGNWGVAIILLTILVRGLLFYPSQKSMVSMRKMQVKMKAMKPRLDAIKKIHKNDPKQLNAEMMQLYKEYGVNPLGGCLPMLLQIPVFFSLYGTLMAAFEIRGAPFFWKWDDLSGPDPTRLFAIFMGATMFLQQKMAPASATMADDQAQVQKMMMYMMPVMFTGMAIMFNWPTGLLLYWSVSNVFGILQQYYVNKTVT